MANHGALGGRAWSCGWPAPAKLNLFLHVTGRRADGHHTLQTLFQFLDWGDALALRPRADGAIRRIAGARGIAQADDLVVRAAHALQAATGADAGADIVVDKHIPSGGGLGGGSSDAATTLVALNHLWGTGLETRAIARIGLALGADVPVFVHGRAAWAEGLGEDLTFVEPREPWYLVIDPGVRASTAALFNAPELTRSGPAMTMHDFFSGAGSNVFEGPVTGRFPAVAAARDWLAESGVTPRLTGTGGCMFAAFADERGARAARADLPRHWRGHVARGANRSRLATRLRALGQRH